MTRDELAQKMYEGWLEIGTGLTWEQAQEIIQRDKVDIPSVTSSYACADIALAALKGGA